MIYRILTDHPAKHFRKVEEEEWYWSPGLSGAMFTLGDAMSDLGLHAPRITNRRAHFYFTEAGWRQIGLPLVTGGYKRGRIIKVIRRKNPPRSQIVYRNTVQLAILPDARRDPRS